VLRELGTELPGDVEVRVWDSTSEERYMVLPERPAGTETLGEEALAALVTRQAAAPARPAMNSRRRIRNLPR
jgi:nitrile hydratase subunit alpha